MNRSFKVLGRYKTKDQQKSWCRGIPHRVGKKRVYTSFNDFKNLSPELIERYSLIYDVEVHELIDGGWVPYYGESKEEPEVLMTIKEAIEHAKEQAEELGDCNCAQEHLQLAKWLEENITMKKEIVELNERLDEACWERTNSIVLDAKRLKRKLSRS